MTFWIYRGRAPNFSCSNSGASACMRPGFSVMGVFGPYSWLRQPLDPPDIGKEFTDLLLYVIAILRGHESTGPSGFSYRYRLS